MERQDYKIEIYKLDRRYKDGERIYQVFRYENETENWVNLLVEALRLSHFTQDKYRVVLKPAKAFVKSLMTGKTVEIREEDRGGCCDPSQERFWCS